MRSEDQRIAIAEACGWKWEPWQHGDMHYTRLRDPAGAIINNCYGEYWRLPDYLNDLNAMHEAERIIRAPSESRLTYIEILSKVCAPSTTAYFDTQACFATAAQRAEAFLRTIGKWEDHQ
jgi:hypothetical protein